MLGHVENKLESKDSTVTVGHGDRHLTLPEKAQQAKTNGRLQLTHYQLPKQETAPESQKHTESSISIPPPGLFDTNNPVYDPAEEEFRRRMQKKKKKRGPRL